MGGEEGGDKERGDGEREEEGLGLGEYGDRKERIIYGRGE